MVLNPRNKYNRVTWSDLYKYLDERLSREPCLDATFHPMADTFFAAHGLMPPLRIVGRTCDCAIRNELSKRGMRGENLDKPLAEEL